MHIVIYLSLFSVFFIILYYFVLFCIILKDINIFYHIFFSRNWSLRLFYVQYVFNIFRYISIYFDLLLNCGVYTFFPLILFDNRNRITRCHFSIDNCVISVSTSFFPQSLWFIVVQCYFHNYFLWLIYS